MQEQSSLQETPTSGTQAAEGLNAFLRVIRENVGYPLYEERALMFAVLEKALRDILAGDVRDTQELRIARQAYRWLHEPTDVDHIFSARAVCYYLGLNIVRIRQATQERVRTESERNDALSDIAYVRERAPRHAVAGTNEPTAPVHAAVCEGGTAPRERAATTQRRGSRT